MKLEQFVVTSSMGKRLIGRGMAAHPAVREALADRTLVIVAGTTNGYVAEEILAATGQAEGFTRRGFRRGVTTPPGTSAPAAEFGGDVVLVGGAWQKGKEIFDVADGLKAGDVVLKGANALSLQAGKAAVYIGDPRAGTIGATLPAVYGRRGRLIVPVGLEKRVCEPIGALAAADRRRPRRDRGGDQRARGGRPPPAADAGGGVHRAGCHRAADRREGVSRRRRRRLRGRGLSLDRRSRLRRTGAVRRRADRIGRRRAAV